MAARTVDEMTADPTYRSTMSSPVLAAQFWTNNGALIADVADLGFIDVNDDVVDVTYGRGIWWKQFRPARLVAHDLRLDGVDFRKLPEADHTFDVVAFDPPYIAKGGRTTTTMTDHADRFGLADAPARPDALQDLINAGLSEAFRVLRPGGYLLVKCQDYVSCGKTWSGVFETHLAATQLGLRHVTTFHFVRRTAAPQARAVRQRHPWSNISQLLVFQRTKAGGRREFDDAPFSAPVPGQLSIPGLA